MSARRTTAVFTALMLTLGAGVASAADAAAAPGTTGAPAAQGADSSVAAASAVDDDLAAFYARRVESLTRDDGWLTLVGLLWLKPGDNTFGRGKRNQLVLDHAALPDRAGTFHVRDGRVTFTAARGAGITVAGQPVTTVELANDRTGHPTLLEKGSLQLYVIERAGELLVRARDRSSPRLQKFAGLQHFPASPSWRIEARFEPYEPVRRIPIMNVLGFEDQMVSPGAIVFTRDGREYRLDAVVTKPTDTELFVMFADATTGHETYGAGRFLYTPLPKDGRVTIDFNRAINPPCAFNVFATCPLPPQQNRLSLRVDAGELKYAGEH
jgi:uncharacterized protein (DUF1684 family)